MAPVFSPDRVRSGIRRLAGVVVACLLAGVLPATAGAVDLNVSAVRYWSLGDVTRVAIEVSGEFQFRSDRIPTPPRLFFDIRDSRNALQSRGIYAIPVGDKLLKQIRVAQSQLAVTRVVLDLEGEVEFSTSQLSNPDRLIIELRRKGSKPAETTTVSAPPARGTTVYTPLQPARRTVPAASLITSLPPQAGRAWTLPSELAVPSILFPRDARGKAPVQAKREAMALPRPAERRMAVIEEAPATGARRTSIGTQSMTRVLGLKVGRVVIDAGHGGHDTGTIGPGGMTEKNLVLDVAKRLGTLVEEQMGSEVVYTRADDTYVPLETRTAIANQRRADLFISIHANSSPIRTTVGVETYYLNFSIMREDLDVAARENASAQKSVYELKDLLQRIARSDKVEESREFASKVQSSMFALEVRGNPRLRNRGVKRAPFVVLIGAEMPSILAEIGFISNPREELQMKKDEYRQKVAEALFKGLSQYAGTLSHFQVARSASASK